MGDETLNFTNWLSKVNVPQREQWNSNLWEYTVEAEYVHNGGESAVTDFFVSLLMTTTIVGNVGLLVVTTWRIFGLKKRSATCMFLMNLAAADILAITMHLPFQVGWIRTDTWKAGEATCRTWAFFRSFSHYLPSFILMGVSVDRYLDVHRPFLIRDSVCRAKFMLYMAWAASICSSLPEAVLHHVYSSPLQSQFKNCTNAESYIPSAAKFLYGLVKTTSAWVPIVVIASCYVRILLTLHRTQADGMEQRHSGSVLPGQTNGTALKLFITISAVFLLCCIPAELVGLWLAHYKVLALPHETYFLITALHTAYLPKVLGSPGAHAQTTSKDCYCDVISAEPML